VSFSPHLLKIMGTEVAEQLLDPHRTAEQRLYQAIIVQAFEDCLYTNGGKNESYNKRAAHDWFLKKDPNFEQVCWLAGFDPDHINYQYRKCLKEKVIYFTSVQLYWIDYKEAYKDYREAGDKEQRASVRTRITAIRKKLKI
jgi:hypothetical protein